ncbi:immunity 49 family protein [Actinomadura sp. SCN-SB]|uniref:immunity 49 family protein n=1 Tax=Actinomadura sp. SCN-SB TaxID=3373092 RepID=UPI00375064DE
MRVVERHELDLAFAKEQVGRFHKRAMESDIPRLTRTPARLRDLLTHAQGELGYRCAADPGAYEAHTWEAATLAMQAGAAIFQVARSTEGTVECKIYTELVAIPATGPTHWSNEANWLKALFLTMICRERERTDMLCAVPEDLLRASDAGGVPLPYLEHWGRALRTWWRQEPEHYDHLIEAVRQADPDAPGLDRDGGEHIALLALPRMKMFKAIVENDEAAFNGALFEALELHRAYWTRDSERAANSTSYIALEPLALACLARELGFTIDVQSAYIPEALLDGRWVGEFPT